MKTQYRVDFDWRDEHHTITVDRTERGYELWHYAVDIETDQTTANGVGTFRSIAAVRRALNQPECYGGRMYDAEQLYACHHTWKA